MLKRIAARILICSLLLACHTARAFGEEVLVPIQTLGKWGFANNRMEIVIPAQWDYASYFRACETAVVGFKQPDGNLLYGLIDIEGNALVPCKYQILAGESEDFFGGEKGYYLVLNPQGTLCGYYDIQNHFFCEPVYEDVDIWYKNDENIISVAKAETNENAGRIYIHAISGEQIGTYDYIITLPWHGNAALCTSMDGRQWIQYLNGSRKEIPSEYDIRSDIYHGLFVVKRNGQFSLMNLDADIVADWYNYIEVSPMGVFHGKSDWYSGIVYCNEKSLRRLNRDDE